MLENHIPGGGNSNSVYFHPEHWGFMIQFDGCSIFQMGGRFNHPTVQRQGEDYLDNINVGNLPGTLWYLHNEAGTQPPWVFLLKMIIKRGVKWGETHHLMKHPYSIE